MTHDDREALLAHNERYLPTSGEDGVHFLPFDVRTGDRPKSLDFASLQVPLTEPGWQRWFVAENERAGIVGDVQLKGAAIRSQLHRCVLGIGLEKPWRGQGLGEKLMCAAIDFARAQPTLDWIDLGVFSGNPRAKALYDKLGFVEVGRREDCFRIGEESVTDIMMTLHVA
jgi:RimJ/RimL family protein N-acetyltransferase